MGRSDEEIRKEIEAKKKILIEKHGMQDMGLHPDMPLEMQLAFVSNVLSFHDNVEDGEKVTMHVRIGSPDIVPEEGLSNQELEKELHILNGIITKNGIELIARYEEDKRKIYKFMIGEFMNIEVDKNPVEGMVMRIIYEEFIPNHEMDLKESTLYNLDFLLSPPSEKDNPAINFINFSGVDGNIVSEDKALKIVFGFKDSFRSIDRQDFAIKEIEHDLENEKAHVKFWIRYSGITEAGDTIDYDGEGKFTFNYDYNYWIVNSIDMPGLKI